MGKRELVNCVSLHFMAMHRCLNSGALLVVETIPHGYEE